MNGFSTKITNRKRTLRKRRPITLWNIHCALNTTTFDNSRKICQGEKLRKTFLNEKNEHICDQKL